eukprot:TRINITY_DN1144_c0_g1_i1.p2 TRINITY_DN1144_c0_g1~~TRINITY_DN1144_c0_g1_i1.p2  ORF type:complete len:2135 (-),score=807.89 TRINITY_DN1144_c0_g1_i1:7407-13811(-)
MEERRKRHLEAGMAALEAFRRGDVDYLKKGKRRKKRTLPRESDVDDGEISGEGGSMSESEPEDLRKLIAAQNWSAMSTEDELVAFVQEVLSKAEIGSPRLTPKDVTDNIMLSMFAHLLDLRNRIQGFHERELNLAEGTMDEESRRLSEMYHNREQELLDLQSKLERKEMDIVQINDEHQRETRRMMQKIKDLEMALETETSDLNKTLELLKETRDDLVKSQRNIDAQAARISELFTIEKELREENESLRKKLGEMQVQIRGKEQEIVDMEENIQSNEMVWIQKMKSFESEVSTLRSKLAECARKEETFIKESQSSESLLTQKEDTLAGLQRDLEKQRNESKERISRLEESLLDWERKCSGMEARLTSNMKKLSDEVESHKEARAALEEERTANREMAEKIRQSVESEIKLQDDHHQKMNRLENEIELLRDENTRMHAAVTKKEHQISEQESAWKSEVKRLEDEKKRMEESFTHQLQVEREKLSEVQQSNALLEGKNESLSAGLKDARDLLHDMEKKLDEATSARSKLSRVDKELHSLKEKYDEEQTASQSVIQELKRQVETLEMEREDQTLRLNQIQRQMAAQKETFDSSLHTMKEENTRLQEEIGFARLQLENKMGSVDEEISALQSHLKRSEEESQRKENVIEQLEKKLDATKRDAEKKMNTAEREMAHEHSVNETKTSEIKELRANVEQLREKCTSLEKSLKEAKQKLDDAGVRSETHTTAIEQKLKRTEEVLEKERGESAASIASKQMQIQQLEEEIAHLRENDSDREKSMERLLSEKNSELKSLQQENTDLKKRVEKTLLDLEVAEARIRDSSSELEQTKTEVDEKSTAVKKDLEAMYKAEIEARDRELEDLRRKNSSSETLRATNEEELQAAQGRLSVLEDKILELRAMNEKLEERLKAATEKLHTEGKAHKKEISLRNEKIMHLGKSLKEVEEQFSSYKLQNSKRNESFRSEIEALQKSEAELKKLIENGRKKGDDVRDQEISELKTSLEATTEGRLNDSVRIRNLIEEKKYLVDQLRIVVASLKESHVSIIELRNEVFSFKTEHLEQISAMKQEVGKALRQAKLPKDDHTIAVHSENKELRKQVEMLELEISQRHAKESAMRSEFESKLSSIRVQFERAVQDAHEADAKHLEKEAQLERSLAEAKESRKVHIELMRQKETELSLEDARQSQMIELLKTEVAERNAQLKDAVSRRRAEEERSEAAISAFEAERDTLMEENRHLVSQLKSLRSDMQQMETRLEESQRTSILQESMTRDERDHFTRQIETHQERADELGAELERAREEIAALKVELVEKNSSLSEAVGSSMALKAEFENELDSLKDQNETLMHRMSQIQREHSVEISEYVGERDEARNEKARIMSLQGRLQDRVAALDAETARLREEVRSQTHASVRHEDERERTVVRCAQLENELNLAKESIHTIRVTCEEEKRALMSEKNKEIHKLRSIIEESRTMETSATLELRKYARELEIQTAKLEEDVAKANTRAQMAMDELERLQSSHNDGNESLQQELASAKEELSVAVMNAFMVTSEIETIRAEKDAWQQEKEKLERENRIVSIEKDNIASRARLLKSEVEFLREKIGEVSESGEAQHELSQLRGQMRRQQEEYEGVRGEMETRMQELAAKNEKLAMQCTGQEDAILKLKEEIEASRSLAHRYDVLQVEHDDVKRKLENEEKERKNEAEYSVKLEGRLRALEGSITQQEALKKISLDLDVAVKERDELSSALRSTEEKLEEVQRKLDSVSLLAMKGVDVETGSSSFSRSSGRGFGFGSVSDRWSGGGDASDLSAYVRRNLNAALSEKNAEIESLKAEYEVRFARLKNELDVKQAQLDLKEIHLRRLMNTAEEDRPRKVALADSIRWRDQDDRYAHLRKDYASLKAERDSLKKRVMELESLRGGGGSIRSRSLGLSHPLMKGVTTRHVESLRQQKQFLKRNLRRFPRLFLRGISLFRAGVFTVIAGLRLSRGPEQRDAELIVPDKKTIDHFQDTVETADESVKERLQHYVRKCGYLEEKLRSLESRPESGSPLHSPSYSVDVRLLHEKYARVKTELDEADARESAEKLARQKSEMKVRRLVIERNALLEREAAMKSSIESLQKSVVRQDQELTRLRSSRSSPYGSHSSRRM